MNEAIHVIKLDNRRYGYYNPETGLGCEQCIAEANMSLCDAICHYDHSCTRETNSFWKAMPPLETK